MCKTRSSSKCLVVKLSSTAKDTQVTTRVTNNIAPYNPWLVITSFAPNILKTASVSPGVKILNKAGMAMKSENKGMNIHVLFKKKPKLIPEIQAKNRHNA